MKKLLIVLLSLISFAQAQVTTTSYTRLAGDYIRPNGSFEHWGTSDWGAFNATPQIPAGNSVAMDYYMRLNWTDIESTTTQGTYSWTIFDNAVNQCIDAGAMFHMAVMDMCSACGLPAFGYPTYLHNLMQAETANSRDWQDADGVWIPNWNSPNYIARYSALMTAIAAHIAGTSHSGHTYASAFSSWDIRSYGDFGEGHTYPWTGTEPTGRTATTASLEALINAAITTFPGVQITNPMAYFDHGHASDLPLDFCYFMLTAQNAYGHFGWRRDNIGDDGYNAYLNADPNTFSGHLFQPIIMAAWQFAPIGGEPANDLNGTSRCGSIQCDLNNEINMFHITYCGNGNYPIPTNDPTNGTALVNAIRAGNAIMGNKLVLDTTRITTSPSTGGTFNISAYWKNINVAPIYEKKWKIIYELRKTSDQSVQWRDTSKFKLYLFLPQAKDSVFNDNYLLTGVAASTYDLHMFIKDSTGYRLPYPLGITGRQTDGSYIIRAGIVVNTSGVPTANAGADQTIALPSSSVTVDGSLSSGALTSFLWTKISGPNTPTIVSPTAISTIIGGLIQGTYVFQLGVNGGTTGSFIDQVTVIVNPAPPAGANAGSDQTITQPAASVVLDGSGSTGTIASYAWTNVSGPVTPVIATSTSVSTTVTGMSAVGTYVFQLSVNGGVSTDQVTVNVNAQPSNGVHIFTAQIPAGGTGGPDVAGGIELGVKFKSTLSGYITGIRFYKTSGLTGTHTGELYTAAGVRLASAIFTAESATGWQSVSFAAPVAITAGTTYIAAYLSSAGLYVNDEFGLQAAITNSPLQALADGASGVNGLFDYTSVAKVPTSSFHSTNYWVDVIFSATNPNKTIHLKSSHIYFIPAP